MRVEESDDGTAAQWFAIAAGILLTLAAAIRFRLLGTTLFEDEVWVANLWRNGDFGPHTYSTPPLFYFLGRMWTHVRGFSDVALREPAAFFGVAVSALPLFARRPWRVRLLWSLLLACSSPMLFYSARAKQYTLEAFVVTLLLLLFLRALERDRWIAFFAVSVPAVMVLFSPIFVLAAMGLIALVKVRKPWVIAGFALVAVAFGIAWVLYLAPGPRSTELHGDMNRFFIVTGRWIDSPGSLVRNTMHWMGQAFNLVRFWWIVLPLLAAWWIVRKRPWIELALCILPLIAIAGASVLHRYPYGEVRLMIFCFPATYLIAAEAIAEVSRRSVFALLLVVPFAFNGVARDPYNATYMRIDDMRQIVDTIRTVHRTGEPIYADLSYAAPLSYYAPELRNDLHSVTMTAAAGPGWYVQRGSRFTLPPQPALVVRSGDTLALRVP